MKHRYKARERCLIVSFDHAVRNLTTIEVKLTAYDFIARTAAIKTTLIIINFLMCKYYEFM